MSNYWDDMTERAARLAYWGTRISLGTLFLASGILKLASPQAAADFLTQVFPIASKAASVLIRLLSIGEIALGCLILGGKNEKSTSVIALMTFLFFSMAGILYGSPDQACGCFGDFLSSQFDEYFLLRNAIFLLLAMHLTWHCHRAPKLPGEYDEEMA